MQSVRSQALLTLTIGGFSGKIHPGGMAEWSKAAVLKIVECNSSVGSNPTPTAIYIANYEDI